MSIVEKQIRGLLNGAEIIVADAGAAFGLPWHLRALAPIATVCYFEPDADAAKDLRKLIVGNPKSRVFTTALAGQEGERTLYVTNVPTGTSLLKPGSNFASEFIDPGYFYPLREVTIHTRRLENIIAESGLPRIDAIKLDVQGAELEILQGLGKCLANETLAVEMEIGFPGGYIDQPGFPEINTLMSQSGFSLYDMRSSSHDRPFKGDGTHYRRNIFRVSENSTSLTKRLNETDAIYFRRIDLVLARKDEAIVRRMLILMCLYGFFIEALDLIDRAAKAGILHPDKAGACRAAVMNWHRAIRDAVTDSIWFEQLGQLFKRASRKLQRLFLKREHYRWHT